MKVFILFVVTCLLLSSDFASATIQCITHLPQLDGQWSYTGFLLDKSRFEAYIDIGLSADQYTSNGTFSLTRTQGGCDLVLTEPKQTTGIQGSFVLHFRSSQKEQDPSEVTFKADLLWSDLDKKTEKKYEMFCQLTEPERLLVTKCENPTKQTGERDGKKGISKANAITTRTSKNVTSSDSSSSRADPTDSSSANIIK